MCNNEDMNKDYKTFYAQLTQPYREEGAVGMINTFNDLITFLYYALYPTANNKFMPDDSGYYIFHVTDIDGEEQLEEVEDDEQIKTLANIFEERFNDEFFDDEEEEN